MPKVRSTSYNTAFQLKVVAEAKAVETALTFIHDVKKNVSLKRKILMKIVRYHSYMYKI